MDRRFFMEVLGGALAAPAAILKYTPAGTDQVIEQPVGRIIPAKSMDDIGPVYRGIGRMCKVTLEGMGRPEDAYRFEGFVSRFSANMRPQKVSIGGLQTEMLGPYSREIDMTVVSSSAVEVMVLPNGERKEIRVR